MNSENYIETLIARVLSGEADHAEIAEVKKWKNLSSENTAHYNALEKIFHLSVDSKPLEDFNTDAAWMKVKNSIYKARVKSAKVISMPQILLRIAAVLLLVVGISYTIYKVILPEQIIPVTFASGNQTEELTLPDSTKIILNRNSQIAYSYSSGKRVVELKGEAFLDLAHDSERPFELFAGTLNIKDIGTSFNVKAEENSDSVIVIVTGGEVFLTSPGNKTISLVKGEQVIYYKKRDEFLKNAIADTNALAYKTKIFVFENANLEVVVAKLGEVYNAQIQLQGNITSCHYTATFKDETLEDILDVIAVTLKLELTKDGNNFILKGDFCEQ